MQGPAQTNHRFKVILAFGLLYVFWGSTYLAIRIAVEHIPPMLMAGVRFLIAGPIMLLWCALNGRRVVLPWNCLLRLALLGTMMLSIGNGILSWSEQWVPSGLAALIISVTPIWFLLIERFILPNGFRVSRRALVGIGLGAAGIVILLWPQLRHTGSFGHRELIGSLALIVGAFSWALGSVFASRWKLNVDPLTAAAYEMWFAGIGLALAGTLAGDWVRVQFSPRGWSAVVYLVIFGSWVGFSSYIWLLNHVSTTKVSTYAYVNPMVAVFLGWLVLHEQITGYILAGSVIVVVAVALVTGTKLNENARAASCEESGDRVIGRSGD